MLSIFRTNQFLTGILLFAYIAIVRSVSFVQPPVVKLGTQGVWGQWMLDHLEPHSFIAAISATVLVFAQAMMINVMVAKYRMADETTLLPGFFYIFMTAMIPEFQVLSPLLIANTFYILMLGTFFKMYRTPNVADTIFNAGLYVALASLFHFSYVVLLLWAFSALSVLRTFNFKETMMIVSGFLIVYFLVGVVYFWYDSFGAFWQHQVQDNIRFLDIQIPYNWYTYAERIVFGLFLLVAFMSFGLYGLKKNIQVQKYQTVLYWGIVMSIFSILFQAKIGMEQFLILTVPLGIFMSFNFLRLSRPVAEVVHLVLLVVMFFFHYHTFLQL